MTEMSQPAQPNCNQILQYLASNPSYNVVQTAASIEASLPSDLKDNVYAYGRATSIG